jgi:hypothetical protein
MAGYAVPGRNGFRQNTIHETHRVQHDEESCTCYNLFDVVSTNIGSLLSYLTEMESFITMLRFMACEKENNEIISHLYFSYRGSGSLTCPDF